MATITYLDFDLLFEGSEAGYRVRILNSPAGQATAEFTLPFAELELENFLLRVGRTRRGVRRLESPEMQAARAFGGRLFKAVFVQKLMDPFPGRPFSLLVLDIYPVLAPTQLSLGTLFNQPLNLVFICHDIISPQARSAYL